MKEVASSFRTDLNENMVGIPHDYWRIIMLEKVLFAALREAPLARGSKQAAAPQNRGGGDLLPSSLPVFRCGATSSR